MAWNSFKAVVDGFLGNRKAENYNDLVDNLLSSYKKLGCRLSLNMLHSHLDFFPESLRATSDEQGERFHQDISSMEKRYQGKCTPAMMRDFCWFLMREDDQMHKRSK